MFEEYIVRNCAPTLAGLKTASMFNCPYDSKESMLLSLRQMNKRLNPKGLHMLPLRFSAKRVLLYLYRPDRLNADICDECAAKLLSQAGYNTECCQHCIVRLIKKLKQEEDFPHEIGLFLGYPPEDVLGFIRNKAQDYKLSGLWKVYGDVEKAKKRFELFRKCDRVYYQQWANGTNIERLAVAV